MVLLIMFTESKYSRCWLESLKCFINIAHTLEKGDFPILLYICLSVIKSIVNWNFLYSFLICLEEYVVFIVPILVFLLRYDCPYKTTNR